ncbi:hypothetical protein Agub_g7545 [Astrephomene gubernaculifera]|uniref:Radical SAM core domain-containing protein n=1 Tax=Astrephomene gubernaculifera TaxID=47775 RepID=A0AAD3DQN7_9CHLO|nr:hypothetical protein Agub_g7545 [Astrephomene gubernaculifera]
MRVTALRSRATGNHSICNCTSPLITRPTSRSVRHQQVLLRAAALADAQLDDTAAASYSSTNSPTTLFSPRTDLQGSSGSYAASAGQATVSSAPLSFEHRRGIRDARGQLMLKNLPLPELEEWCASVGEPPKRARQLYRWLYGNRKWIRSLDEADSDPQAFSAAFKAKVSHSASLSGGLRLRSVHTARDGTRKLVYDLVGGEEEEEPAEADREEEADAAEGRQEKEAGNAAGGAEAEGKGSGSSSSGRSSSSSSSHGNSSSVWGDGGKGATVLTRGSVETVLIPMTNRSGQNLRYTACLSTQVGCAQNCQFCHTGRMGLLGHLSTAQIVEQLVQARRYLAAEGVSTPIANVVFMGMGEPLHNYEAVMPAIEILATGLELSRNKIIVSTVGLVPEMRRFLAARVAKLAVSLHATTDEVRDWLVPTNRRYPLEQLMGALREAFPYDKRKGDDFVVIEYVLLAGVNDSVEDAQRLLALTADVYCLVNLIVFNPHAGTPFQRSSPAAVFAFRGVFLAAGRPCTVRASKGDDQMAACGQLGDVGLAPKGPVPLRLQLPSSSTPVSAAVVAA